MSLRPKTNSSVQNYMCQGIVSQASLLRTSSKEQTLLWRQVEK